MVAFNDQNLNADRTLEYAVGILEENFSVLNTFTRMADDKFYGRNGSVVNIGVEQTPIPTRRYSLFNARNEPLKMDFPEERLITLTVEEDRIYNAIYLRDEVQDFQLDGQSDWSRLIGNQARSLANFYEEEAKARFFDAEFEYVKHVDLSAAAIKAAAELGQDATYNAFEEAKSTLSLMGSPVSSFSGVYALVGSNWASHLRRNQRLVLAQGNNSQAAFSQNVMGTYAGITFVEVLDPHFPADEAYVYTGDAFLFWSSAPSIPRGAHTGAFTNQGKLALRWLMDYSTEYQVDRSFLSSYTAWGETTDHVFVRDTAGNMRLSDEQYFVRGVKLVLGGSKTNDILPGNGKGSGPGAKSDSYLAKRFNRQAVDGPTLDKGIYSDLTYQNVKDGVIGGGAEDATPPGGEG